jgi:hypothetical protein
VSEAASDARWLDRAALAAFVSGLDNEKIRRMTRAGKLPPASYHIGPRSPRWWSPDVDAMLRSTAGSPDPDRLVQDAIAQIANEARPGRAAPPRGRHR